MAKKVLIIDATNDIAQIEDVGNEFEVAPGLTWVDTTDNNISTAYTYDGVDFTAPALPVATLVDEQVIARAQIDQAAENKRLSYITQGDGQSMTYINKSTEAQAFKDAGYPTSLTNYPWIQAESIAMGTSATVAADNILSTTANWLELAVAVEEERLRGKKAVTDSIDIADVASARDAAIASISTLFL